MALTTLSLANQALVKLGANTITALSDSSVEAKTVSVFLDTLIDGLISSYAWGFATAQTELELSTTEPVADFKCAFDLPDDFLRIISAGTQGRGAGIDYRIYQRSLHTNSDTVILTYIYRPESTDWPAFFDPLVITRLAAELCIPLTENTSRAEALFRLADDEFKRAKLIDSQQDTPIAITDFALITARD